VCIHTFESPPCAPVDLLDGTPVGDGTEAVCTGCKRTLQAGAPVVLYAYCLADTRSWDAARLYCEPCAPETMRTPTLGAHEALLAGSLATRSRPDRQTHTLTFAGEAERAYSPPDRGSPS